MTNGQRLTDEERMEYQEIGNCYRHDDQMTYQAASILLPLAFGSIPMAVQFPKVRYALAIFSLALYSYWLLISIRLNWHTRIRQARAQELERKGGLSHHLAIAHPAPDFQSECGYKVSVTKIRWFFLVLLVLAWLVVLILLHHEVLIEIETLAVYRGWLSARALGMVLEWAALHQDELRQDWELARNGQVPRPIAPLM